MCTDTNHARKSIHNLLLIPPRAFWYISKELPLTLTSDASRHDPHRTPLRCGLLLSVRKSCLDPLFSLWKHATHCLSHFSNFSENFCEKIFFQLISYEFYHFPWYKLRKYCFLVVITPCRDNARNGQNSNDSFRAHATQTNEISWQIV